MSSSYAIRKQKSLILNYRNTNIIFLTKCKVKHINMLEVIIVIVTQCTAYQSYEIKYFLFYAGDCDLENAER